MAFTSTSLVSESTSPSASRSLIFSVITNPHGRNLMFIISGQARNQSSTVKLVLLYLPKRGWNCFCTVCLFLHPGVDVDTSRVCIIAEVHSLQLSLVQSFCVTKKFLQQWEKKHWHTAQITVYISEENIKQILFIFLFIIHVVLTFDRGDIYQTFKHYIYRSRTCPLCVWINGAHLDEGVGLLSIEAAGQTQSVRSAGAVDLAQEFGEASVDFTLCFRKMQSLETNSQWQFPSCWSCWCGW